MVTADESQAIALIPGISHGRDSSHCFIQVMDGTKAESRYHRFDPQSFKPNSNRFRISIEDHTFGKHGVSVDLPELQGAIYFKNCVMWRGSVLSPGIMGWYSFVPFMQCYHGLVSIHHDLEGSLTLSGQSFNFDGGKGYIEKDWGRSFPKSWIWTQCNHFDYDHPLSLMASVAHIPWLGSHFIGFLALIWDGEKIKIFTTYTGAEMKAHLEEDQVTLSFRDREDQLSIRASMAPGVDLVSPVVGEMVGKINESLQASQSITYRRNDRPLIEATGTSAGLEVAENHEILLSDEWRK